MKNNRVVLITGASSGIGLETAKLFLENEYIVYGVARNLDRMSELKERGAHILSMDVTDSNSIKNTLDKIKNNNHTIDILVNNAGYAQNGFVEELTKSQLQRQFDVNVFGLLELTQAVLPDMRERKQGHIINVGSVGGDFTSPGASAYHASKYALESFSDGLRQELRTFGINVSLIKPGGVQTAFVDNANDHYPEPVKGNPYGKMRANFLKTMSTILDPKESSFPILQPVDVAKVIFKASQNKKPKSRYRVGSTAKLMPVVKTILSDRAFDRMLLKQLKIHAD